jgi:RNA polymerase sigma-70 factor (ECF subfamily)
MPGVNDREWIRAVLQRYEAPLLLYAARLFRGSGDGSERARDAVQETFLELCSAERADVEPRIAAWLFTVCRNKALDLRRKELGMSNVDEIEVAQRASAEPGPAAELARGEEHAQVIALLARLPEKQQEAVRLKFQGGLSYAEIATVMGTTAGNVGFLIHVALRAVRERLAVEGKVA